MARSAALRAAGIWPTMTLFGAATAAGFNWLPLRYVAHQGLESAWAGLFYFASRRPGPGAPEFPPVMYVESPVEPRGPLTLQIHGLAKWRRALSSVILPCS